jgi:hypothetical protein
MKVSQILHVERCCKFAFHTADFIEIGVNRLRPVEVDSRISVN